MKDFKNYRAIASMVSTIEGNYKTPEQAFHKVLTGAWLGSEEAPLFDEYGVENFAFRLSAEDIFRSFREYEKFLTEVKDAKLVLSLNPKAFAQQLGVFFINDTYRVTFINQHEVEIDDEAYVSAKALAASGEGMLFEASLYGSKDIYIEVL